MVIIHAWLRMERRCNDKAVVPVNIDDLNKYCLMFFFIRLHNFLFFLCVIFVFICRGL